MYRFVEKLLLYVHRCGNDIARERLEFVDAWLCRTGCAIFFDLLSTFIQSLNQSVF